MQKTKRTWSRQRVIDRIQALHRQGIPVGKIWRHDKALCIQSYSHLGSWRAALEAAGLESPRRRWRKQDVIDALKAWHAQQQMQLRKQACDPKLSAAAKRCFGSVCKAKQAAGVPYSSRNKTCQSWSEKKIIDAITSLYEQGNLKASTHREYAALYAAAKRILGSWNGAKRAAGVPTTTLPPLKPDDVIRLLKDRSQQGLPLTQLWKTESRLYSAIKRHFGNLTNACDIADIPVRRRQVWTKARIIGVIQNRQAHGPPLAHVWRDDKPLFSAAGKHFGNWRKALKAARIPSRKRERWSKSKIIEGLKATYRGQPRFRDQYPGLAGAAYRFFGSFFLALEAAELEPPVGRWTKARIIENIQELYVQKSPLQINGCGDKKLADAAKRHFGSWREAVKAAGLESRLPAVAKAKVWTRDLVITEIHAIASKAGISRAWHDNPQLYEVAFRIFGTWNQALLAAGVQPTRRRWSKEVVLDGIRHRYEAGLSLSSSILKSDPALVGAALRLFGTWRKALDAAGISKKDHSTAPSRNARRKKIHVA